MQRLSMLKLVRLEATLRACKVSCYTKGFVGVNGLVIYWASCLSEKSS